MRPLVLLLIVPATAMVAIGIAAAANQDPVPLFTSEDVERMFGPAPAQPSDPVDKTRPEDWRWVEQFLDRQYSRIDADRRYDLDSRTVDVATERVARNPFVHDGSLAWGLGYPASTWWNKVASIYGHGRYDHDGGDDRGHRGGHGVAHGGGPSGGPRARSK